ncbi:hypothetical protein M431DRAFT_457876 [Trichoderma harzianum CBS 226.95]|uniref:Uncharacterized protein n=1 Tax=Trichoderma harzianum CBS 226.95 TaxID=983964 RepID=A0A2T4A7S2_TRIHA|nr:hypothetical protein M431DRAFT_457876 [Trichoderma harzianum CBS 226.95]PTB53120.1 hypothetical protein M431DRAFT_457876 [Trichoderma harzianum CBS 226.95]
MQSKHDVYASPKRGFIAQRLPCAECYFKRMECATIRRYARRIFVMISAALVYMYIDMATKPCRIGAAKDFHILLPLKLIRGVSCS